MDSPRRTSTRVSSFRSDPVMDATTAGQGFFTKRCPSRCLSVKEIPRAPRFLLNSCLHALLFDPGGSSSPHHDSALDAAFRSENDVGSALSFLSGLNHTAYRPPVYASQPGSLRVHATLGPARWLAFTGAGLAPASSHRRFRYVIPSHTILPLQA
jgi:hypothetical protein